MVLDDDQQLKNFVPSPPCNKKNVSKNFYCHSFTAASILFKKLKRWFQEFLELA